MKTLAFHLCLLVGLFCMGTVHAQNGLSFDGINDRIDCGNDPSVQITGNTITLEAWIYPTAWKPNIWEGNIIDKEQWTPEAGYMLRCGDNGRVNFNIGNFGWNELNTGANTLVLNQWQHVAGTYDGSMMRVYVDGVLIDSLATTTSIGNTTEHLTIGDNSFSGRNFDGTIDEVRIWNIQRTQAELQAAMNSEFCTIPAGLVAYYQLDEGIAGGANGTTTIAYDATGNANNGDVQNLALSGTSSNWVTGQTLTDGMSVAATMATSCGSYTVPSGNATYTSSGSYVDTLQNSIACDSVLYIDLSITSASTSTINPQECTTYTSPAGNVYTAAGTYMDTLTASSGCDSIITINLTLGFGGATTINENACSSYTVPSGNATYTTSGTYMDTLTSSGGCDSILTINLSINDVTNSINASACTSYTVPSGNATYTVAGTYMDTLMASNGCDSILTITLTLGDGGSATLNESACASYTVPSGNATYTTSGTYLDTLTSSGGCDSILTINLSINNVSTSINASACSSYTVPSGNATYTVAGTYMDTLPASNGCDSILTITLTLGVGSTATITESACSSYTVPSGNATYTTSGTYMDTIATTAGCDSVLTINLTIGNVSNSITESTCDSYTVPSGNATYTTSGIYMDTLQTSAGCDSVLTIDLTIGNAAATIDVSECTSYTVPSGSATYAASGTYTDTLQASSGCDSVLTINLTIGSTANTIDVSACDSYTLPSGSITTTTSGVYTDSLLTSAGCDSILTINLTIEVVETGIFNNAPTLSSAAQNATYQWLDCDDAWTPVSGATSMDFTATANGSYAVEVTQNGCADTSVCETVSNVGWLEVSPLAEVSLWPNPAQDRFTIDFGGLLSDAEVTVYDLVGRAVLREQASNRERVVLQTEDLSGLYVVVIRTGNAQRMLKVEVLR